MGTCKSKEHNKNSDNNIRVISNQQAEKEQKPIEAKIVLLGDQNVGKSSIAQRFCKNLFTGQHITTIGGAYMQQKIVLSNGVTIKFHIWDTGGQERFRSMANLYYRDAAAAILTYDITNEKSFESLSYWVEELKFKCDHENLVLCLAGNKCDVDSNDRKVQTSTGKCNFYYYLAYSETHNMLFWETSAKNDIGIKELFNSIAKKIYGDKNNS
jgi:small GTP-binding protein